MLSIYVCDVVCQRWIYRIDPKRVNEYGQVLVEEEKESKKKRRKGKDARHVVEQPETLEDMEDMAARLLG